MFSRSFMRNFNSNKYLNPIRRVEPGTTKYFMPPKDFRAFRVITSAFVMLTGYMIYNDPTWFYETFFHPHYPTHPLDVQSTLNQVISRSVPDSVRIPNEQAIETAKQIHEMKELLRLYK